MDGWSDERCREVGNQKLEDQSQGQRWLEAITRVGQDPAWVVVPGWMDGWMDGWCFVWPIWYRTCTCDLFTPTAMYDLKLREKGPNVLFRWSTKDTETQIICCTRSFSRCMRTVAAPISKVISVNIPGHMESCLVSKHNFDCGKVCPASSSFEGVAIGVAFSCYLLQPFVFVTSKISVELAKLCARRDDWVNIPPNCWLKIICPSEWTVRDSSVGIATSYGLECQGIESRWGAIDSAPVQTGPGAHPSSYAIVTGAFPGLKQPGHGGDHPPHLASRLKKEYSSISTPHWAFMACSRVIFTFTFTFYLRNGIEIFAGHAKYLLRMLVFCGSSHF
jgi:hypothetical protein